MSGLDREIKRKSESIRVIRDPRHESGSHEAIDRVIDDRRHIRRRPDGIVNIPARVQRSEQNGTKSDRPIQAPVESQSRGVAHEGNMQPDYNRVSYYTTVSLIRLIRHLFN